MSWFSAARFGNVSAEMKSILRSLPPAIGLLLAVLPCACRKQADSGGSPAEGAPVPVRALAVESRSHPATEEVVGTVQARLRAVIEAKASGRVEKMLAAPGQSVKAGDLLVQLDAREIQARLDQAVATRDQAARDTERLRLLLGQNAISRQEFETVESRHRVAAGVVAEAETLLGYTKVVAPFSGVITRKLADVGDLASPGRALLEMEDPAVLRVETGVPESLIRRVRMGAALEVRSAPADSPVLAVVSEMAPAADPGSRTFNVKLDLPAEGGLRAGQFARVSVPVGESAALLVPAGAVFQRGQMEIVFVVADRRAQLRLVKTGRRLGSAVELVSGVSPGERVVVEGADALRDGQAVEVQP